jgi:hypothetical protein
VRRIQTLVRTGAGDVAGLLAGDMTGLLAGDMTGLLAADSTDSVLRDRGTLRRPARRPLIPQTLVLKSVEGGAHNRPARPCHGRAECSCQPARLLLDRRRHVVRNTQPPCDARRRAGVGRGRRAARGGGAAPNTKLPAVVQGPWQPRHRVHGSQAPLIPAAACLPPSVRAVALARPGTSVCGAGPVRPRRLPHGPVSVSPPPRTPRHTASNANMQDNTCFTSKSETWST